MSAGVQTDRLANRGWLRWAIKYREAKRHAALVAVLLWSGIAVFFFLPGDRFPTGDLKGADFVYFYTIGHIAFDGDYPRAQDHEYLYARQVELVPASVGDHHISVYPPIAAIVFRSFTLFSYETATVIWALLTLSGYITIVYAIWYRTKDALTDGGFVALAAASFPPIWYLVLYGQTTIIPLAASTLAWLALRAGRTFSAGVAIGLLAIKPQFGVVLAIVLVVGKNWRVAAGAVASVIVQLALVILTMGPQAIFRYIDTLYQLPKFQEYLEPYPYRMHSLSVLTNLLPGTLGMAVWSILAVTVLIVTIVVWRSKAELDLRFSIAITATVLLNPHLFVYDATVLALPLLLSGAWVERCRPAWRISFWQVVYGLFVLLLFPTALIILVQGSVLAVGWIFGCMARAALQARSASTVSRPIAEAPL